MAARDGRQFELAAPTAVAPNFERRGVDLPVDTEHQNHRPEARLSGPVLVGGWIKALERRSSGLWERIEWAAGVP